jgi:hypothetical protein
MQEKPYVVGIDCRLLQASSAPELVMQQLGHNAGSMVFSEALYRHLGAATRGHLNFEEGEIEGRDCIVVAAANKLGVDRRTGDGNAIIDLHHIGQRL